ncbi:MAG: hexitol phosphatase HxpB [Ferruginibacter sp.]|nr:hexitol phosphatase HxpB [Ferruginibacter sp.]
MKYNTVIFDMDGLLIDSEPLWKEAADELLLNYGFRLTKQQYSLTTGLRTKEFLEFWFTHFNIPLTQINTDEEIVVKKVIELVKLKGRIMPGVPYIFNFFKQLNFKIGLASSSPSELIDVVVEKLNIGAYLQVTTSASNLAFGKPHPEVYLNCAKELGVLPAQCICFEDSYNGMIAVKAAKMKCIIIPNFEDYKKTVWDTADLKISTLHNFNELLLAGL